MRGQAQVVIEARAADDRIRQAFLLFSLGSGAGNTAKSGQENNSPILSTQIPGPPHLITLAQTFRRSTTMSSQPRNPDGSKPKEDLRDPRSTKEKVLDSIADDAAEQAEKEEQGYDEQHDIFTR